MHKYNNYFLIILAVASIGSLLLFDNLESAYAFSISQFSNGTADVRGIAAKDGEVNFAVTDFTTDSAYVRNQNTKAQVGSTITGVTDTNYGFTVDTLANRAYFSAVTAIYEIDLINAVLLRTISTASCSGTFQGVYVDEENGFYYCASATQTILKIDIASGSTTYTSTTVNAGGSACNGVEGLSYDSTRDIMFAICTGTSNIVAVEDFLVSGTPDFSVAYSATGAGVAFNDRASSVGVCSTGAVTPRIYDYDEGVGFTLFATIGTTAESCQSNKLAGQMMYDHQSDRFFYTTTADNIYIVDGTTGSQIVSFASGGTSLDDLLVVSNSMAWGNYASDSGTGGTDYFTIDLTGIALGGSGESGGTGSGLDCTLPENEFILTCRLGGDGSLVGAGSFIIGNVSGSTGLVPIMCSVGLVDCEANPDVATNGAGYLIVGIAIAVWVGVMWVASRGDLSSIPTFLWFIGALLIVGAFTVAGVIDVVFFIVTIIFVCALATAKAKGLLGGGF